MYVHPPLGFCTCSWLDYFLYCSRFQILKCKCRRRKWQPTPVFLLGKVHGQRSLVDCSPWDYMPEHACMKVEGDGLVAINW